VESWIYLPLDKLRGGERFPEESCRELPELLCYDVTQHSWVVDSKHVRSIRLSFSIERKWIQNNNKIEQP